jgi:transposase
MLGAHRQRQLAMHQAVRVAIAAGQSVSGIAQRLQLSRSTVRKYRDMAIFHDQRTTARPSATEPYRTYLEQRWAMGYTQIRQLWHELQALGYRGGYKSVWQFTRQWHLPTVIAEANMLVVSSPQPLRTPRHVRWLLTRPSDTYTSEEQTYCSRLFQHCPDIAVAAPLIQAFSAMIRGQQHDRLDEWVACAQHCSVRELHRFALSVQEDLVAVRAALTYPWSQGQVEGQVTRLKLVKRQMYGRATFGLLRARVLHRG